MKKHVNHLICIMTPWQYFVAHYGCRQITTAWSKMFSTPTQWTDHQGKKRKWDLYNCTVPSLPRMMNPINISTGCTCTDMVYCIRTF
jgi:hypothetical protein